MVHVRRSCTDEQSEVACGEPSGIPGDAAVTGVFEAGSYSVFADAREREVAGLRWEEEVDLVNRMLKLPAARMKGKKAFELPMSDIVHSILVTRRAIVACLAERPRAVGELADELPVSRPAVSQHLKVLKNAGLVTERAAGTRRIYRLNPAGVGALRDQLEVFWNRALASYKDVIDEPREDGS